MNDRIVWYIHGANSSPVSFTRIKEKLPEHTARDIVYDTHDPVEDTLKRLIRKARKEETQIDIVAHSLGGVLALLLAHENVGVNRVVTMSSPFGGSKIANLMKWWLPDQLFSDIATSSTIMRRLREQEVAVPTVSLVTTKGGTKLMSEDNDGVVTVSSQLTLSGPRYIKVGLNHFEILLSDAAVNHINEHLFP